MIKTQLLENEGILIVTPTGKLEADDFKSVANEVDNYLKDHDQLNGLMIYTESFPGWKDFSALVSHLKFVKDHHRFIKKVAAVTDDKFLSIAPNIAQHFVNAEVKHFKYSKKDEVLGWLKEETNK